MKRTVLFSVAAVLLAAAVPATASTFLALDREALVAASDAVVIGEVVEVHSFWNAEATAIRTEALVRVSETLAGNAPSIVRVQTIGGQVGPVRIEAHGFPTFEQGQRLVLFLEGAADVARVVGYQQGQFRIVARKSDGMQVAVPTVDAGANLIHRDGQPAARPRALTLNELRSQVSAAALRAEVTGGRIH